MEISTRRIAGLSPRVSLGLLAFLVAGCSEIASVRPVVSPGSQSPVPDRVPAARPPASGTVGTRPADAPRAESPVPVRTSVARAPVSSANAATIADLENRVNAVFGAQWVEGIASDAGVDMYFRWPAIDGLVDLYLATGNSTHIDRAVAMASRYVSLGRDLNGDGYRDWFSSFINGHSHGHVEFRAANGIARIAEILHADTALNTRYQSDAQSFLRYLERDVWEKAEAGALNANRMLEAGVTHFIARSGLVAVSLYKITGKRKYLDWIERRGSSLRDALVLSANGAYTFNCNINGSSCTAEATIDTSHAGDTVNFIVEAHRAGLVFDAVDIERLVNTVKRNLWNGSLSRPRFNDLVDGSGGFGSRGRNQGGWVKLATFDDELRDLYYAWILSPDLVPLPPTFSSLWGTRVHILGNLARAYAQ